MPREPAELFALGVMSSAGGELSVFSPMIFIAPDTLALNLTNISVASFERQASSTERTTKGLHAFSPAGQDSTSSQTCVAAIR